jgi:hypothetical protein
MKLYTAVLQEIFILKSFSAHDVTKSLRDKVNNGELSIPELKAAPPVGVSGSAMDDHSYEYEIKHEDIRDIVVDIYENLKDLVPLTRKNQGFWHYQLVTTQGAISTVTNGAKNVFAALQSPRAFVSSFLGKRVDPNTGLADDSQVDDSQNSVQTVTKPDSDTQKVRNYVINKGFAGERATLRGAHSSLKKNGLTLRDIQTMAESLGFKVQVSGTKPYYDSEIIP